MTKINALKIGESFILPGKQPASMPASDSSSSAPGETDDPAPGTIQSRLQKMRQMRLQKTKNLEENNSTQVKKIGKKMKKSTTKISIGRKNIVNGVATQVRRNKGGGTDVLEVPADIKYEELLQQMQVRVGVTCGYLSTFDDTELSNENFLEHERIYFVTEVPETVSKAQVAVASITPESASEAQVADASNSESFSHVEYDMADVFAYLSEKKVEKDANRHDPSRGEGLQTYDRNLIAVFCELSHVILYIEQNKLCCERRKTGWGEFALLSNDQLDGLDNFKNNVNMDRIVLVTPPLIHYVLLLEKLAVCDYKISTENVWELSPDSIKLIMRDGCYLLLMNNHDAVCFSMPSSKGLGNKNGFLICVS